MRKADLETETYMQDTVLPLISLLVDTWMLTHLPASKDVFYDLNYKHTHFEGTTENIYDFFRPFLLLHCLKTQTLLFRIIKKELFAYMYLRIVVFGED